MESAEEAVSDALYDLGAMLRRLDEPLTEETAVSMWIAALVAAGVRAEHGTRWVTSAKGGYPKKLPFAVQFQCPHGHRTEDRRDRARVQIIIESVGWWSLDPDSPCTLCGSDVIARWLLMCPRCEAGEDSDRHDPDHAPFDISDGYIDGVWTLRNDTSPVALLLREIRRRWKIANARWWTERYDEAASHAGAGASEEIVYGGRRMLWSEFQRAVSLELLGAQPRKVEAKPSKPTLTPEETAEWLDSREVPDALGEKATWARVKELPGCPPQSAVYAGVKLRKRRPTVP
ncbi:hypothetical protein [Microbacterium sp. Root180]|uniref:hypothetical protein n=1 Tax=Microbacterium sp. Root180 TaxID=1736483 RepID=UPI0012FB4923|nr:hypothetical protein [Microbacterium sp. Root180]